VRCPRIVLICAALGTTAASLLAQNPTIGGGTCSSSSLNGTYEISLTGRQTATAAITSVLQANGLATFDGLNKATVSLTSDTLQAAGTSVPWSGTYSIQANCVGQLIVNTGGNVTFDLLLYNGGTDFLLAGSDATYAYTGSGNSQPASCAANMLSGVYTFNGTGYALNATAVSGVEDGAGLLQFDGAGNITANITLWTGGATSSALTLTGSYTLSNCAVSAKLTDSKSNSYSMSFSVASENRTAITTMSASFAQSGKFLMTGTVHSAYGQPSATPQSVGAHDTSQVSEPIRAGGRS